MRRQEAIRQARARRRARRRRRQLAGVGLLIAGAGALAYSSLAGGTGGGPAGASAESSPVDGLPSGGLPAGGPVSLVVASPAPSTRTASVSTQISLLGKAANSLSPSQVSVTGSVSGAHAGAIRRYSTDNGASFVPSSPFVAGEQVTVRTHLDIAGAPSGTFSFRVGERLRVVGHQPLPPLSTSVAGVRHYASAPGIEPPQLHVSSGASSPGGDLFLSPKGNVGQAGPMIVDPSGRLVWFDALKGEEAFDFNIQRLGSEPVLTWFQGVVADAHGVGEDVVVDRHYRTIAVLAGANGFAPDLHEFQLLPDGIALITSYQALHWDLAPVGGPAQGLVWDGIAQEIDLRTGLVEYEWHSLDHVGVALSVLPPPSRAGRVWDYFHINSLQQLTNGDLLVSGRNTSAAYEVSPAQAGRVVFELGGRRSSVAMGPGTTFWLQHDVEIPAPGIVTIFDDEASPTRERGAQSRALVESLDTSTMSATLLHSFTHSPPELAAALGNVQSLPGGSYLVEWGTTSYTSQYDASGALVFDASLPAGDDTYRTYRAPWSGAPTSPPSVVIASSPSGSRMADMSWNGATDVASWRVLAGPRPAALSPVATVSARSFQTSVPLPAASAAVKVQALSGSGRVLGTARSLTPSG